MVWKDPILYGMTLFHKTLFHMEWTLWTRNGLEIEDPMKGLSILYNIPQNKLLVIKKMYSIFLRILAYLFDVTLR